MRTALVAAALAAVLAAGCSRKAAIGGATMATGTGVFIAGVGFAAEGEPTIHTPVMAAGVALTALGLALVIDALVDDDADEAAPRATTP